MLQRNISMFLLLWMIFISYFIITISIGTNSSQTFFNFGPNDKFIFFGIAINNFKKYYTIITFSFMNSCVRKLNLNVIQPWITLNIQNEDKIKTKDIVFDGFFISNISNLYNWIDWIIYMNLLLAQVDIVIVEILAEMLILNLSTYYYIFLQNKYEPINCNEDNIELEQKINLYSSETKTYGCV